MRTASILATLTLFTSLATAQTFQPFGTGCTINGQTLAIGNQGLPQIGTTFQVTYTGPNSMPGSLATQQAAHPNLVLGFGQQLTPIPPNLLPLQPAGCQGFITPDTMIPTTPFIGRGIYHDTIDLPVPNNPALIGAQLYAQWLTVFEQCGVAHCTLAALLTSDAALITIG